MKKKLESELISIAHRVLKLKSRSETIQLHEETKKLYDQLTVLRFYEENIEIVAKQISLADLEAKLENSIVETPVVEVEKEIKEEIAEDKRTESTSEEEPILHEEDIKQPQSVLFEDVFGSDFLEPDFVKVNDVPVEVQHATELSFEAVEEPNLEVPEDLLDAKTNVVVEVKEEIATKEMPEKVSEDLKSKSLNDKFNKGINIGLNDRIAFEKKLFGGSANDFNRVLSQLNTFDSLDEASEFINDFVKPDYNNWEGKEEYETRFMEIVEKKFS